MAAMKGYNFTERVRRVLAIAREEGVRLRHQYVGTEHILLGLLAEGEGVASTVLANLGIDAEALKLRVGSAITPGKAGEVAGPDLPYTSRAKKVLELAMGAAHDLHHSYVGTEHLLLGLLAEEKGIAAQVLVAEGLTLPAARAETLRILGDGGSDETIVGWRPATVNRERSARAEPPEAGPPRNAAPRRVVVELQHDDGWIQRREFGSAQEAMRYLADHRAG